ncbi:hypothetical protein [Sporichthya polymorpha]|uniref:hypothetical protein n=1 Tax=Sporichthya polymorpha TaxID=35751 RepID=UPI00036167DC|nr:hypothetical protein [Sporichthya polymorpha]
MSTPMTSPGNPGEVQVDVESLDAYLREVLIPLSERAHSVANKFTEVPLSVDMFGPIPHAKQLAERHKWGFDVYRPTLEALANDVDTLVDKLGKVIQTYRDQDDQVGAALAKLGAVLSGEGGYTAAATWERERAEHGGTPASLPPPPLATAPGAPSPTTVQPDTLPEPAASAEPPPAAVPAKPAEPKPSGTDALS